MMISLCFQQGCLSGKTIESWQQPLQLLSRSILIVSDTLGPMATMKDVSKKILAGYFSLKKTVLFNFFL